MWQAQARVRQQLKLTVAASGQQNVASAHWTLCMQDWAQLHLKTTPPAPHRFLYISNIILYDRPLCFCVILP